VRGFSVMDYKKELLVVRDELMKTGAVVETLADTFQDSTPAWLAKTARLLMFRLEQINNKCALVAESADELQKDWEE
jgi:hypothetical protein